MDGRMPTATGVGEQVKEILEVKGGMGNIERVVDRGRFKGGGEGGAGETRVRIAVYKVTGMSWHSRCIFALSRRKKIKLSLSLLVHVYR